MKIGKKICLSLFAMVASLLLVNSVNATGEVYTINIDEEGTLTAEKTSGGNVDNNVTTESDGKYIVGENRIVYSKATGEMVISENVQIKEIVAKNDLNLIITTNNKEAFIDRISVSKNLEIVNSKISYDDSFKAINDQYFGSNILIKNSTINIPSIDIHASYGDLFVENSTVNAKLLFDVRGALKINGSTVTANSIAGNNVVSNEDEDSANSMQWKNPEQYIYGKNNGRAFYHILIVDSNVNLVGEENLGITSYRGILIQNSNIKDKTNNTQYAVSSIDCLGEIIGSNGLNRELTIKDSNLELKERITAGNKVDVVIEKSKITSDSNIALNGGNLTVKDSTVKFKYYPGSALDSSIKYNESAISVNGDIIFEDSRVTADASKSNGKIVAIAYSGSIDLGKSMVAIDKKGNKLVKDIKINGIEYNSYQFKDVENIYTLGLNGTTSNGSNNGTGNGNGDGSNSGTGSDLVDIGEVVEVTVSIEGGTWSDGTTKDKVINKMVGDTITEKDLPSGMKSNDGSTSGRWNVKLPLTLSKDTKLTYVFSVNNPETYDSVITFLVIGLVSLVSLITVFCLRKKVQ